MTEPTTTESRLALVTGASGSIGALLVPKLLDAGFRVRVLARTPGKLNDDWRDRVEVVQGDASEAEDVRRAVEGVDVAYYLLHSMDSDGNFAERDRLLAHTFADAAAAAEVGRLVYLSGLHPDGVELSDHLASRVEVGEILLASGVPTAVLQAGVVLGDGSASFDMLRHLTERLPAAFGPRWLNNHIRPIAVDDALFYLLRAADLPAEESRPIDIGMDEVLTYSDMMRRYARVVRLHRRRIGTVPVLTPELASYWVGFISPVDAAIARPLVGSLTHDAVGDIADARRLLGEPEGGLTGYDAAIRRATRDLDPHRWGRTAGRVVLGVAATAVVGSVLSNPDSRWFRRLDKPDWQPPNVAFPLVWSALYGLIAVAGTATVADLAEDDEHEASEAFGWALAGNLVLNAAWSGLFFRAHNLPLATAGAAALAASSADLTRRAAPAGWGKAAALGAYTAWCGFATALSASLARRNR
ncbi:tryptophan-rich sensory protein [Propioniciclava soli]|uniref:Tryptophan-rich sensory protein n=1 Tax=Propioniciclava soli TaxID=2775081 RepID=A0ABZ3C8H0_9ACTN|nr:tryptophan-rich sensory protein [Propioniciclava soli]